MEECEQHGEPTACSQKTHPMMMLFQSFLPAQYHRDTCQASCLQALSSGAWPRQFEGTPYVFFHQVPPPEVEMGTRDNRRLFPESYTHFLARSPSDLPPGPIEVCSFVSNLPMANCAMGVQISSHGGVERGTSMQCTGKSLDLFGAFWVRSHELLRDGQGGPTRKKEGFICAFQMS